MDRPVWCSWWTTTNRTDQEPWHIDGWLVTFEGQPFGDEKLARTIDGREWVFRNDEWQEIK